MFEIGSRLGTLVLAGALFWVSWRTHRASKHAKVTRPAGIVLAFLSGCAVLASFVGEWMAGLVQGWGSAIGVAALLVCLSILVIDWVLDRNPDKPAFFAALALPVCIFLGWASLGGLFNQVGEGVERVTSSVEGSP